MSFKWILLILGLTFYSFHCVLSVSFFFSGEGHIRIIIQFHTKKTIVTILRTELSFNSEYVKNSTLIRTTNNKTRETTISGSTVYAVRLNSFLV